MKMQTAKLQPPDEVLQVHCGIVLECYVYEYFGILTRNRCQVILDCQTLSNLFVVFVGLLSGTDAAMWSVSPTCTGCQSPL